MNNKRKISAGTAARTIVLALALINQICAIFGWVPLDLDEEVIYQLCTAIATTGTALWAWWKNNSFTKAAIKADQVLQESK